MPTDMERMIVALEARTKAFENALIKSDRVAQQRLKSIERQFAQTNKKLAKGLSIGGLGGVGSTISGLRAGAAGLVGGLALDRVRKYADAWTEAGNKIAAASVVSGKSARSLDDINRIATATRSGITETTDLYAKLLRATKDVAKNEQQVADATEIVNKAFKAGGASASEQAAGVLQLSQALGSGLLQGDELRSIRENAPLIAQAIANEFKTTIGGLKQLGADGKLTVDRVFKAILDAKPEIDKAFNSTQGTIADNIGLVNNALTAFVGKLSEVSGLGSEVGKFLGHDMVGWIDGISESLDDLKQGGGVAYLTKLAETLDRINRFAQRLGGGIGDATGLNRVGPALGLSGGEFSDMLDGMEKSVAAYKEIKALDEAFSDFRSSIAELKPEAVEAFDALQKQIDGGTISANKAKKALHDMFGDDPMYSRLLSIFDELLDKLQKVEPLAKAARQGIDLMADDPGREGWGMLSHNDDVAKFIKDRDDDANRSDLQKKIDDRADKIVKAAEKVGIAMTEAAAKIQAAKEIASEDIAKRAGASADTAASIIRDFERFSPKAYWDVNHYRAGYGSDTVTDESGGHSAVTKNTVVSLADADRDLLRRIGDTQQGIRDKIGADTFNGLDEKQQAALTSIAYNYGSLPQRIVDAIKSGNQATVVQAIRGLGSDNGGINRNRRNTEADLFLGGAPSGVQKAVRGEDRFKERLDDTSLRIDLLNKEAEALGLVNPLVNDYGYAQSKAEIKQKLLNDAMDNGVEITPEYAKKIDDLAERYAKADASRNQMQVGLDKLNQQMQQSSEFGKNVLGGFIQDIEDGTSATEALSNALKKVADRLLEMGLNTLFDGGGLGATSGGGVLGGLFKWLFPFANGGVARNGKPLKTFANGGVSRTAAIFGETGRAEAAVPLPDGRNIPVDLRTPNLGKKGGGSSDVVTVNLRDDSGRMADIADQQIRTRSGTIVNIAVQQSQKTTRSNMGAYMSEAQVRQI